MILSTKCSGPLDNLKELWKNKGIETIRTIIEAIYTERPDTNFEYNEDNNEAIQDLSINNNQKENIIGEPMEKAEEKSDLHGQAQLITPEKMLEEELNALKDKRVSISIKA